MPRKVGTAPALNVRQRKFVDRYMVDFNAIAAAKDAGYKAGLGEGEDRSVGTKLLRHPAVQAEIRRRCVLVQVKYEITRDHILQGFAQIAFDPRTPHLGGPAHGERIAALREIGKLEGLYIERHAFAGATLEQLLATAGQREKGVTVTVEPPPVRLIQGGKA